MTRSSHNPLSGLMIPATSAIGAWDLREQTLFSREGADESIRELFLYVLHHHRSGGVRRTWTAVPVYTKRYGEQDRVVVVAHTRGDEARGVTWKLRPVRAAWELNGDFEMRLRLHRMHVVFSGLSDPTAPYTASVVYVTRCGTFEGFYWISFFGWVSRCTGVKECADMLEAIAANIDCFVAAIRRRDADLDLICHLIRECRRCSHDSVRLAAMERRIERLWGDVGRVE